jgi:hypothetical protein
MAASHAALGDWASAVESYEAANRLEPGNAGTMTALKQVRLGSEYMSGCAGQVCDQEPESRGRWKAFMSPFR